MKCQATKTRWIQCGREDGAVALIIYVTENENCYCHQVMHKSNVSRDHDDLEEQGYTIIEEIFL